MDAGDWFLLFWTIAKWQILIKNTNKDNTNQQTPESLTRQLTRMLYRSWQLVTIVEINDYIAIVIVLGVYRV